VTGHGSVTGDGWVSGPLSHGPCIPRRSKVGESRGITSRSCLTDQNLTRPGCCASTMCTRSIGRSPVGQTASQPCTCTANLHGKWFWLKFREAGGWLIASRIHNRFVRLAGCTGTGPGTRTPDAAAASCRKRAASGPSEHARPPSRNLSQNPVSGTFLASYLAVLGDLFGRPAVFARLARTIVRKSGHLACKDPAR
jgi:hypothetical protein